MRSSEDIAALQLEALSNFLAFTPRDPSLPLSEQITRDAATGDVWARRVMHSRVLECPQSVEAVAPFDDLAIAPLPSIAVAARPAEARKQARDVAQGVVVGVYAQHRRRSVGTPARRLAVVEPTRVSTASDPPALGGQQPSKNVESAPVIRAAAGVPDPIPPPSPSDVPPNPADPIPDPPTPPDPDVPPGVPPEPIKR